MGRATGALAWTAAGLGPTGGAVRTDGKESDMKRIAVVGAGHIGSTIASLLAGTGDYEVLVMDRHEAPLKGVRKAHGVSTRVVDVGNPADLLEALTGAYAVTSAAPFHLTTKIADAALECGVHYLDLTEDVESTRYVQKLAAGAKTAFIPQCGLAPGFVSIAAYELVRRFDEVRDVRLRVGALPQFPSNALGYNLTWSTEGLINEYCEPCEAIVEGVRTLTTPLEECEELKIDGIAYEAFNTSGGLGTLCQTLDGKVTTLNYRTMRYPGHAAIMRAMLNDLRLREFDRRGLLKDIFEGALPQTMQDVVVIFVTVSGWRGGKLMQDTYTNKVYAREIDGIMMSGIQITTASSVCAVLDLLAQGQLPASGFVRQEDITLPAFLENRFGAHYGRPNLPPV